MNDTSATPHDPRLGTLFEGRYRIESLLGKGGFGAVYRAAQLGIERPVALKILVPELASDPTEVARFEQEARIIAGLDHPHVVKLIELGRAGDGSLFLAMEHLEGEPFSRYLRREAPLPLSDARRFGAQILEALAEAHASGVVHRDLKPENLFVVTHPRRGATLKLLDFGIAKVAGENASGVPLTRAGVIIGSPRVMAPEQIVGDPVTPRTDVYAFGCVAYQMLTGRPPFVRPSTAAYARAHLNETVPWPSRDGEPVRGPLADLVMMCLTKDPQRRPESAEAVLALWLDAGRVTDGVAPAAVSDQAPATGPFVAPLPRAGRTTTTVRRPAARGRGWLAAGAIALAGLGAVAAYATLGAPGTIAEARGIVPSAAGGTSWVEVGPSSWLTRTEVTAAQYARCVAAGGCDARRVREAQATATRAVPDAGCNYAVPERADHPMNCVSQAEAAAYCAWEGGALPTAAAWELEARDGAAGRSHPWGAAEPSCAVTVMGGARAGGCGRRGTWSVCEQGGDRSVHGLCDMGGNVTEWLGDLPTSMAGGLGPELAALAGGAWHYDQARAFENGVYGAERRDRRYTTVGFRCARTTPR